MSITLITGIMASGKSTVAQALAERRLPGVHVRGDVFRRMIVSGREEMSADPSPGAIRQLELRYRLMVRTAIEYHQAGFQVVCQDVILGGWLQRVVDLFGDAPVDVVVLSPRPEVVATREAGRAKTGYGSFTVDDLDRSLRDETPRIGRWIDTSDLTVEETVDMILAGAGEAEGRSPVF